MKSSVTPLWQRMPLVSFGKSAPSTISAVIVTWERQGAITAQPRSNRQRKLSEQGPRVPKHAVLMACFGISSVALLTTEFKTACGRNINTNIVHQELHETGFHDRAAAHEPKASMCNAKRPLEWRKARRR